MQIDAETIFSYRIFQNPEEYAKTKQMFEIEVVLRNDTI